MSNLLEYTLSLQDKMTSKLAKIGINSDKALDKFSKLEKESRDVRKAFDTMGKSISTLDQKLALLRNERDLIPASNLKSIRAYNKEIGKLERQVDKLQRTGFSGGKLKDAAMSIPGAAFLMNPYVAAGTAMAYTAKQALSFDEGMAKINITAQLSQGQLTGLKDKLLDIGLLYGSDINQLPESFASILDQVNDVNLSLEILKTASKGSKAGFADLNVVADALSRTMSIVSKEGVTANEVLDMMFAAKRVGAGEFEDYARYLPQLIAGASALGIKYKQVGGMFSYMTGKGQSPEQAATLIQNVMSALSKADIQKELRKNKLNIFDKSGAIRDIGDIFTDLKTKMGVMTDEQKSQFLQTIGLVDVQAKQGFEILMSDTNKLRDSLYSVANATGEVDKAMSFSKNTMQDLRQLWSQIQVGLIKFGSVFASILKPVLTIAKPAFKVILNTLEGIGTALSYVVDHLINFKTTMISIWEKIKGFKDILYTAIIEPVKRITRGLGGLFGSFLKLFKGDFAGAYLSATDAFKDLSGDSDKKLVKTPEMAGTGKFYPGVSLPWTMGKKNLSMKFPWQNSYASYITPPSLPGASPTNKTTDKDGSGKATTEAIALGGTKTTNVTINLKDMIGNITFTSATGSFKESAQEMSDILLDKLTRVLSLGQSQIA